MTNKWFLVGITGEPHFAPWVQAEGAEPDVADPAAVQYPAPWQSPELVVRAQLDALRSASN